MGLEDVSRSRSFCDPPVDAMDVGRSGLAVATVVSRCAGGHPVPRHAAVIAILIIERPMCLDCIATKSALSTLEVERYLEQIGRGLELRQDIQDRCRVCGEPRTVFSLSRLPE